MRIVRIDDSVTIAVRNDGRGFGLPGVRAGGGLGILGMEERVKLLGGTLQVCSRPGAGTEVRAELRVDE